MPSPSPTRRSNAPNDIPNPVTPAPEAVTPVDEAPNQPKPPMPRKDQPSYAHPPTTQGITEFVLCVMSIFLSIGMILCDTPTLDDYYGSPLNFLQLLFYVLTMVWSRCKPEKEREACLAEMYFQFFPHKDSPDKPLAPATVCRGTSNIGECDKSDVVSSQRSAQSPSACDVRNDYEFPDLYMHEQDRCLSVIRGRMSWRESMAVNIVFGAVQTGLFSLHAPLFGLFEEYVSAGDVKLSICFCILLEVTFVYYFWARRHTCVFTEKPDVATCAKRGWMQFITRHRFVNVGKYDHVLMTRTNTPSLFSFTARKGDRVSGHAKKQYDLVLGNDNEKVCTLGRLSGSEVMYTAAELEKKFPYLFENDKNGKKNS